LRRVGAGGAEGDGGRGVLRGDNVGAERNSSDDPPTTTKSSEVSRAAGAIVYIAA
jgi:hypothetical protein